MTFDDLNFVPTKSYVYANAYQALHTFPNGYTVSVINYGYGAEVGLYELAILVDGALCYDTFITDDVIGYLTKEDVTEVMEEVQELPKRVS